MIEWFERNYKVTFFITILISIIIYIVSEIPGPAIPGTGGDWIPKVYHVMAFFFLAAFVMMTLIQGKYGKYFPAALILSFLYALSDEFHQLFVPGRYFSLSDIFLDSLGIAASFVIYYVLFIFRR